VLPGNEGDDLRADPETDLAAAAVSGQVPPAGPQWAIRLRPPERRALAYDKPLCASMDGFTLHAATRAGALDATGREALLRYVLRPPIAQDKVEQGHDGLIRIVLKKPFPDGTIAVEMDPLSLLCRLAASVPPPRHHTVRYAGVLGAASEWRSRIVPPSDEGLAPERAGKKKRRSRYRTWAELLARTFGVDALACPVSATVRAGPDSSAECNELGEFVLEGPISGRLRVTPHDGAEFDVTLPLDGGMQKTLA
jgi:hypothetical protein